jgi:alpha-D-ribose 1-methylphosphonate 5-triphosphate synthase subunit PhnI
MSVAYVAVKGGKRAIEASIALARKRRIANGRCIDVNDIRDGMCGLLDVVMSEASLYGEAPATLAVKQAEGSPEEAVFLLRAFRSTLPRVCYSTIIETDSMFVERRISAAFMNVPGGQILGPSLDYSHRLLDFSLWDENPSQLFKQAQSNLAQACDREEEFPERLPKVCDYLRAEGLLPSIALCNEPPRDITKHSMEFPTTRSERLQVLTRGQTGAIVSLGYASLRAYGLLHPTVAELRVGRIAVKVSASQDAEREEDDYYLGEIRITEVETLVPISIPRGQGRYDLEFDLGYGFCFGSNESKAIAMSLLDQGLERPDQRYPNQNEEFVLLQVDSVEANGFISHLKLPHYVTFQSKLDLLRTARQRSESGVSS